MQKRKLGKSNLEVSALGLGCMGMSFSYGPPKEKQEMIKLLHAAVERGVTFFDTAEVYGPFMNEELVGEALAPLQGQGGDRDQVWIQPQSRWKPRLQGLNSRPEHIKQVAEASLKRLQDRCHRSVLSASRRPECADRRRRRRGKGIDREGKVKHFGMSEAAAQDHSTRPCRAAGHGAAERVFALVARDPEAEIMPTLEELGIGFVPFSPLGKGFLTGRSTRRRIRQDRLPQHASRASLRRTAKRTRRWWICSARWQSGRT